MGMDEKKKELAKVIEKYFGADAGYLDISCLDLARVILEAGWEKPVRCKVCKNFERKFPGYGYCYHWDYEEGMSPNEVEGDDFCSYGERREGE